MVCTFCTLSQEFVCKLHVFDVGIHIINEYKDKAQVEWSV